MTTRPIADFKSKVQEVSWSNLLVSLVEIYPKKTDLLRIPDASREFLMANAMYLHEKSMILLDDSSKLFDCAEVLCRLTAQGVDAAKDIIKSAKDLDGNASSKKYGFKAGAMAYVLTPHGERGPEQPQD